MTYYSQRKSILNGVPQAINNRYGTQREMERQFHLYCANACDGVEFPFDIDSIEWGTIEHGAIERKTYIKPNSISDEESETDSNEGNEEEN